MVIELGAVLGSIAKLTTPLAKQKLARNEAVIKVLKQFNINPTHPDSDFDTIYVYALVEYGIDRPKQMLELLRLDELKQLFRYSFDQSDLAHWQTAGEQYIERFLDGEDPGYTYATELRELSIDTKWEFLYFGAVFVKIVKQSRTPKETLLAQQVESLQAELNELHQKLDCSPGWEDLQTEVVGLIESYHLNTIESHKESVDRNQNSLTPTSPQKFQQERALQLEVGAVKSDLVFAADELSKLTDIEVENIQNLRLKGFDKSAYEQILALKNSSSWRLYDSRLQAKILKELAYYSITIERNIEIAEKHLKNVIQLDPELDIEYLRILIIYDQKGSNIAYQAIENKSLSDIREFNLKLAFLLELHRYQDVVDEFNNLHEEIEPNSITKKCHALAVLSLGDVVQAKAIIIEALNLNPEWQTIREAYAIILYHGAIAYGTTPKSKVLLPEPIDWAFIKEDSTAIEELRKAEEEFYSLAEHTEQPLEMRVYWQTWQLACLANDIKKQDKAQQLCQKLLDENPTNIPIAMWGISRKYEIDFEKTINELQELVHSEGNLDTVTGLLFIYTQKGLCQEAHNLLELSRAMFEATNSEDYWYFWSVEVHITDGDLSQAFHQVELIIDEHFKEIARIKLLKKVGYESGDWAPLVQHFESCYQNSQDARYLFELCQLKGSLNEWSYVFEYSDDLRKKLGNAQAIALIVKSAWFLKKWRVCINLLNQNKSCFLNESIPHFLSRIKAESHLEEGQTHEAIKIAETLVNDDETTNNLITLFNIQFRIGDTLGYSHTARRLLKKNDIYSSHLLWLANCCLLEDKKLAGKFWARVISEKVDNDILGEVINLGFRLGREKEIRHYITQAQLLAHEGKGPFQTKTIPEILKDRNSWFKHLEKLNFNYEKGEIPLHIFSEVLQIPMAYILVDLAKNRENPNPYNQTPILTRFGNRFFSKVQETSLNWRIHLDLSAFFLADHLDILDKLEEYYKPLRISPSFQTALIQQRTKLLCQQPSQLKNYRNILALVRSGKLLEIKDDYEESRSETHQTLNLSKHQYKCLLLAQASNGFVVDFWPLVRMAENGTSHPVELNDTAQKYFISCRILLDALLRDGVISQLDYNKAIESLGSEGKKLQLSFMPVQNSSIYLNLGIASVLAESLILEKICRNFQVYIHHSDINEQMEVALERHGENQELGSKLVSLIDRVHSGLEDRIYEIVQIPEINIVKEKSVVEMNLDFLSALDLFKLKPKDNDVFWVDDRFFSKFLHHNGAPIVGIFDVLAKMRKDQNLSENEYFEKVLDLRRSNVRYIPISAQEIVYHLKQASRNNGVIVESEELRILRQYLAACYLDSRRLQYPRKTKSEFNLNFESAFLSECVLATFDAIASSWEDTELSLEEALAFSSWIFVNLYTGNFGIKHFIPSDQSGNDDIDLLGLDIGNFYAKGFTVSSSKQNDPKTDLSLRQSYFQWLDHNISQRRFRVNKNVLDNAADWIKSYIEHSILIPNDEDEREDLLIAFNWFCFDLPESLQQKMCLDAHLSNVLQLERFKVISIGDFEFSAQEFWQAASNVVNGQQSKIHELNSDIEFKVTLLKPSSTAKLSIEIESKHSKEEFKDSFLLSLLSANQGVRRKVLDENWRYFDCDRSTFEKHSEIIIQLENPCDRIESIEEWRNSSLMLHYISLKIKLNQKYELLNIDDDFMPPSADSLLNYLRIDYPVYDHISFKRNLALSAQTLINDIGLKATLDRFICLPFKLPNAIFDTIHSLSQEHKNSLFEQLEATSFSPLSKLHVIDILLDFSEETSIASGLLKKLLDDLFDETLVDSNFKLFHSLLNLSNNDFYYWDNLKTWPSSLRLALTWVHATKLHNVICDGITNNIDNLTKFTLDIDTVIYQRQISFEAIASNIEFTNNVLHPRRFNWKVLIIHGLSGLIADRDPQILSNFCIPERIQKIAFIKSEEEFYLDIQLWNDPTLTHDNFGSIFSIDRSLFISKILGDKFGELLVSDNFKTRVEQIIRDLQANPIDREKWIYLAKVVDDLPIYSDLSNRLNILIKDLNISALMQDDLESAFCATTFIFNQIKYFPEDFIEDYLLDKMQLIAEWFRDSKTESNIVEVFANKFVDGIIQIALIVSTTPRSKDTINKFLIKIMETFEHSSCIISPLILMRLVNELPSQQLKYIWPLVILSRAVHKPR